MELGFATDFAGESTSPAEIRKTLELIKRAGFTHVHWCHEWDGDYTYSVYEMHQIQEWMEEIGLKAKSFHAAKGSYIKTAVRKEKNLRRDYTSDNEYNRLAGVELIRNRMQMAELLGAHEIVLHMYLPYMTFLENPEYETVFYTQVFKSLDELQEEAKERGIKICIENLLEIPGEKQMKQFDRLFERYDKDYLGLCLDTGHGNIVFGDNCADFAKHYADRIYSVHINDNLGGPAGGVDGKERITWGCDLHMIPGEGNIDWEKTADVLANSAYELPLVMELSCKEENIEKWLEKAWKTGCKLTKQIDNRKINN